MLYLMPDAEYVENFRRAVLVRVGNIDGRMKD